MVKDSGGRKNLSTTKEDLSMAYRRKGRGGPAVPEQEDRES